MALVRAMLGWLRRNIGKVIATGIITIFWKAFLAYLDSIAIHPDLWLLRVVDMSATPSALAAAAWLIAASLATLAVILWDVFSVTDRMRVLLGHPEQGRADARPRGENGSPTTEAAPAASLQIPHDVDARSALLYAANRTWAPRLYKQPVDADTAPELQRLFDALNRFYESASHEGGLRVWGRTAISRPPKLVERTHWQDWHINYPTVFADPANAEPLRTVPRDRLPDNSSPYFDLRLNKAEVESLWPADQSDIFLPIQEAGRICFEETGFFSNWAMGGELRLYQFVVLIITEAKANPDLLSVWGIQTPSTKMARIPAEWLETKYLRNSGTEIQADDRGFIKSAPDWINVSVKRQELLAFIERLKQKAAAGQRPDTQTGGD